MPFWYLQFSVLVLLNYLYLWKYEETFRIPPCFYGTRRSFFFVFFLPQVLQSVWPTDCRPFSLFGVIFFLWFYNFRFMDSSRFLIYLVLSFFFLTFCVLLFSSCVLCLASRSNFVKDTLYQFVRLSTLVTASNLKWTSFMSR